MGDFRGEDRRLASEGCHHYWVWNIELPTTRAKPGFLHPHQQPLEQEFENTCLVKVVPQRRHYAPTKRGTGWWASIWVRHTVPANSGRDLSRTLVYRDPATGHQHTVRIQKDHLAGAQAKQIGYFFDIPYMEYDMDINAATLSDWLTSLIADEVRTSVDQPLPKIVFERPKLGDTTGPDGSKKKLYTWGAITDCPMAEAAVLGLIAAHNDPNIDTRLSFEGTELLVHTSLLEAQKEATNRARKVAQTNESEEADTIGRKVITRLIPGDKLNEVAETIIQSMGPEAVENQQVVQSKNLIFTTLRTTQLAMDMIRLGSQEAFAPRPTITELARPKRQFVVDRPVDSWQSGGSQGTWQQQSDTWQSGGSQGTARESVYGPAYDSWTGSATNQQAGWGQGNNTVGDLFGQADQSGSNGFRELREAQKKDRAEMDVMRRTLSKVEHSTDKVIMNQAALETMLTQ